MTLAKHMDANAQQVFARWLADSALERISKERDEYKRKYEALRGCWPGEGDAEARRYPGMQDRIGRCCRCRARTPTAQLTWCDYCGNLSCAGCFFEESRKPAFSQHICYACGKTACSPCSTIYFSKEKDERNSIFRPMCNECLEQGRKPLPSSFHNFFQA